jgi:hypothetical protein
MLTKRTRKLSGGNERGRGEIKGWVYSCITGGRGRREGVKEGGGEWAPTVEGMLVPLPNAIRLMTRSASSVFPVASSHRGDSGVKGRIW